MRSGHRGSGARLSAPRTGTAQVELSDPGSWALDLRSAPRWYVLALRAGLPHGVVEFPAPGKFASAELTEAVVLRHGDERAVRERLRDELRGRLGVRAAQPPRPTVSVVLCTHRRPRHLPAMLEALSLLRPAPTEVVVVDNDPGAADCRELVERYGFRYVQEPRRGLDNARNTGFRSSVGEIVVFSDDDCAPPAQWLSALAAAFSNLSVGAVTGPAFPAVLETPSQVYMERLAGMTRGFERRSFDWTTIAIAHASATGVGANMAFRRQVLAELGDQPFPPELDVGTRAESGGDTYVLAQVLARGHRVIYEPSMFTFHRHRADPEALQRALRGYGVGIAAAMTKLLIEDRELGAWRGYAWLVRQYLRTQGRRAIGDANPGDARLSAEYVLGGLQGPGRWIRARAEVVRPPAALGASQLTGGHAGHTSDPGAVTQLTVVIPTHRRPDSLARCLDHLGRQTIGPGRFQILVADDAASAELDEPLPSPAGVSARIVGTGGTGASSARNLGAELAGTPLVLFLDDDMAAEPDLIERHLEAHRRLAAPGAVVGAYPPFPPRRGLTASIVAFWWNDTFAAMSEGGAPSFSWMLSGNLSVSRAEFLALGGFSPGIPFRREDWELGVRWLGAGHELVFEPMARVRHEFELSTAARLRGIELEGFGDAALAQRHPSVAASLPLVEDRDERTASLLRRMALRVWRIPGSTRLLTWMLDWLERLHLRPSWLRVVTRAWHAAYKDGLRRGRHHAGAPAPPSVLDCDLLCSEPLTRGAAPPVLRVTVGAEEVARVRPEDGLWSTKTADTIVALLSRPQVERLGLARGWIPSSVAVRPERDVHVLEVGQALDLTQWWSAARQAAQGPVEGICALVLPGARVTDERWLDEALVALDGELVGAVFGSALDPRRAVKPLYLHDSLHPPPWSPESTPAYLLIRSGLLSELGGFDPADTCFGRFGPAATVIAAVMARGLIVGHRSVHGLVTASGVPFGDVGRAWAAILLSGSPEGSRGSARQTLAKVAAVVARDAIRGRGRVDPAIGQAGAGAALAVASARLHRRRTIAAG